jgi:hypothetical protein
MTKLARSVVVIGVGLLMFGAGDAAAQVAGPGVNGVLQGGMCLPELSSYAPNVSYYAGNGGITVITAQSWVQCPVLDVTGLIPSPIAVFVWIENTSTTTTSTCDLHRVSLTTGFIQATTSVVAPAGMTSVQEFQLAEPSGTGGFYSMECFLAPGATVLGYYVNMAN